MSHVPTTRTGVMSATARPPGSVWRITIVCLVSLLYVASSAAQSIPVIGSLKWYFDGYDAQQEKFPHILSMDHAVNAGFVLLGTNTHSNLAPEDKHKSGELIALDAATGQVLKRDSVCPQFRIGGNSYSLRFASINDSGTVVCYSCYANGVHLATWPDLVPIVDTMLRGATKGWISNTGRYLVLAAPGPSQSPDRRWIYDRQTGDTAAAPGGMQEDVGAQFSADDRFHVRQTGSPDGSFHIVVSLPEKRVFRDDFPRIPNGQQSTNSLARDGRRLLVRTTGVVVYDIESGQAIWGIDGSKYSVDAAVLSPDGSEVIALRSSNLLYSRDTSYRRSFFRYRIPETRPNAVFGVTDVSPGLGSGREWTFPQMTMPDGFLAWEWGELLAANVSYNPATGVGGDGGFTPILYPNPASSSVTMQVGDCSDALHIVSIHDQSGKEVWHRSVPCVDGTLTFDVTGVSTGAYDVSVAMSMSAKVHTAMVVIR